MGDGNSKEKKNNNNAIPISKSPMIALLVFCSLMVKRQCMGQPRPTVISVLLLGEWSE